MRLYGPEKVGNNKFAEFDIEPEYVGITGNNKALVALQENNALAEVNLKKGKSPASLASATRIGAVFPSTPPIRMMVTILL